MATTEATPRATPSTVNTNRVRDSITLRRNERSSRRITGFPSARWIDPIRSTPAVRRAGCRVRSAVRASSRLWVTKSRDPPSLSTRSCSRSMISRPVVSSRLPVGFVGQHQLGAQQQGAADGHALHLAAAQLAHAVAGPVGQAHALEQFGRPGSGFAVRCAGHPAGQSHVLAHAEVGQQVEELEHQSQVTAAQVGAPGFAEGRKLMSGQLDAARCWAPGCLPPGAAGWTCRCRCARPGPGNGPRPGSGSTRSSTRRDRVSPRSYCMVT